METIRQDWPKRWLRELRASLDIADENLSRDREAIERELRSPSRIELGVYSTSLQSVAGLLGRQGVIAAVDDGAENAWQLIARSLHHYLASFRVRVATEYPNGGWHDTNQACLLFATAITLQSRSVAEWLADLLISSHSENGPLGSWRESPFQAFSLHLAYSVAGVEQLPIEPSRKLPDIYSPLLAARNVLETQTAVTEFATKRVCLVSPSYGELQSFEWSPFDLFPVDILAALTVFQSGIPRFDFGCLESPLCDPPIPFPRFPVEDELVDRVIARVSARLPMPTIDWQ